MLSESSNVATTLLLAYVVWEIKGAKGDIEQNREYIRNQIEQVRKDLRAYLEGDGGKG